MSVATESATYLYCAVRSAREPLRTVRGPLRTVRGPHRTVRGSHRTVRGSQRTRERLPHGLPGAGAPRALAAGQGLWLIAAAAPLDRYSAETIDARLADLDWVSRCAMAHDAVVEHVARHHPVIPMKLFTLFTSDERAVAHVARTRRKLDRLFQRVADREEWGVRLLLDEARALVPGGAPVAASSGTDFLVKKKAAKDSRQRLVADALDEADSLYEALARLADDSRRRTPAVEGPTSRMVLDAAYLVRRGAARRFRAAVAKAARPLAARGLTLTLTGPWPPYHFVADES